MYPTYNGVKQSLSADDIAGIRNIYSGNAARDMDRFARAGASNNTFATASPLAAFVSTYTLTAAVTGLDLYAASDVEYLTATVPSGTTGTMSVNVQSNGISLLSPKVTVYAADQKTVLGTATGLGKYGTSVTLSVSKLLAGQQVYLVVQGADSTVFATGSYDLGLSFNANAAPTFATTARPIAAGLVLNSGGGIADIVNTEEDHYTDQAPTVIGIVDDTGVSTQRRRDRRQQGRARGDRVGRRHGDGLPQRGGHRHDGRRQEQQLVPEHQRHQARRRVLRVHRDRDRPVGERRA